MKHTKELQDSRIDLRLAVWQSDYQIERCYIGPGELMTSKKESDNIIKRKQYQKDIDYGEY